MHLFYPQIKTCLVVLFIPVLFSCAVKDGAPKVSIKEWDQIPDAIPEPVTPSNYGNPESYEINGKRYHVLKSAENFAEEGFASWYGTKFHGRRTSSGETYDMFAMTAAHKSLPIPVYVEVVNQENGRRVVVKVNDRGPFHEGRIIDLSYAAATKLGIHEKGTAKVKIRVVKKREFSENSEGNLYVHIASYKEEKNAFGLIKKLRKEKYRSVRVHVDASTGVMFYRVRIGPLPSEQVAKQLLAQLKGNKYTDVKIINYM